MRRVVEGANSTFQEVHQENDYGTDALVELVDGETVTGQLVIMQIKSGRSYCSESRCWIPASEEQLTYWRHHALPVVGVVYDPVDGCGYWVNISERLSNRRPNETPRRISFQKSLLSRLDERSVREIFAPRMLGKPLAMAREDAARLAQSDDFSEHVFGLRSLFHGSPNDPETWDLMEELLLSRNSSNTSRELPYLLAHAPWHGDIAWSSRGPHLLESTRKAALERMRTRYGAEHVLALTRLIGNGGFDRGTVGQSVYAIVDLAVSAPGEKLQELLARTDLDEQVQRNTLLLLCLVEQGNALAALHGYAGSTRGSVAAWAVHLLKDFERQGFFYP